MLLKTISVAALVGALALGAGHAAQAHDWGRGGPGFSFGVQIPIYAAPPEYYAPPPAYYAPQPEYYVPPVSYYQPYQEWHGYHCHHDDDDDD